MKNIGIFLLLLIAFVSCKDQEVSPSLSGTFTGPITIRTAYGLTSYSDTEITLKQLTTNSVEVSGYQFETFVIKNISTSNSSSTYHWAGDGDNIFRFSGSSKPHNVLLDWTSELPSGPQTIHFGGNRKK